MVDDNNLNLDEIHAMSDWIEQYSKRLEESNKVTQVIVGDDNYINWLIEFTSKYPEFCDDSWLYCPELLTDEEREKVEMLSNFFEVIDRYATMNYLPQIETKFGYKYLVRHNNIIFEVGIATGQGTIFHISRSKETENVIDFSEIKENKQTEKSKKIDSIFEKLDNVITELKSEQVQDIHIVEKTKTLLNDKR